MLEQSRVTAPVRQQAEEPYVSATRRSGPPVIGVGPPGRADVWVW